MKDAVDTALADSECYGLAGSDVRMSFFALVNVGGELAKVVPGRVSTEVDACLTYDTHSIVRKVNLDIENANAYPPCLVDMDIEKGNSETPKTNDKDVEKLKIEGPLTHLQKALQRQISLQIGEKVVQLLMNSLVSPKFHSRVDFTINKKRGLWVNTGE
ncbi:unnamed protein product [Camellia sinensis]